MSQIEFSDKNRLPDKFSENVKLQKIELRKKTVALLKNQKQKTLENFDFGNAKILLAYLPLKSEVNVVPVINCAISSGLTVAVPTDNFYLFAILPQNWREKTVKLANKTLTVNTTDFIDIRKIDKKTVMFVPGLLFTKNGNRLGRGAGFYDKVLAEIQTKPLVKTVGICTNIQITDNVPTEPTDICVSDIIVV